MPPSTHLIKLRRSAWAARRVLAPLALAALLSGCLEDDFGEPLEFERAETAVDYEIELVGVENKRVRELMEEALALYRQQDRGAQSLAFLRRRAQGDIDLTQKILRSFGFFEAEVEVEVESVVDADAAEDGEVDDGDAPAGQAIARVIVTENRRYDLTEHRFTLVETGAGPAPTLPSAEELGSPIGKSARASRILAAEAEAVDAIQEAGRPYAKRIGRDAVADRDTAELEVETTIATGGFYRIGNVSFEGAESVERDYLRTYFDWDDTAAADPAILKTFQRRLVGTGLFNAATVSYPDDPPAGDVAPILVSLEERPPRTISGGVRYDTDAGPAVRAGFEHRNLFGSNETITLEGLVGLEEQSLDSRYRIPQFERPGQDLVLGLDIRRIDDEAFEEIGGTLALGLERELTEELTIGFGGLLELTRVEDLDGGKETSYLVGAPVFASFDSTNDPLDPAEGIRMRVSATPFAGMIGGSAASFMVVDGTASTYFDLTGSERYILAARGRLGSIVAGDFDVVSANRRLYSGGGGSVRGYAERFIGELDEDGDPIGGLSVAEAGLEMRARVSNSVGVAGFAEAGAVSTSVVPDFSDGVQFAVGGGVRYFSPIGPLRVDVGFPVNPRDEDDFFQLYISIGQAF